MMFSPSSKRYLGIGHGCSHSIQRWLSLLTGLTFVACAGVKADTQNLEWPLHGRSFDEKRYSPLRQIDRKSVNNLGLAWIFEDFIVRGRTHRGNEATPIVKDAVVYFSGPWSVVYALDAKTGRLRWRYDPKVAGQWARKACCDVVNRGVALWQGKVYVGTLDGYLDRLDARTGKREWRVDTLIDRARGYTITGAPRIAGDKIVIGNGGAELGVRGYVSAYFLDSGKLAWRFYTVPGPDPEADEHPELAMARQTWSAETQWAFGGGGTVWDSMTYDPGLNWIYIGVGNGSPWPAWLRSPGAGDHLFLSSILALDAATGRLQWHYQTTPGDSWDYTATQQMILADRVIAGKRRRVLMQAPKNGFFYVLDAVSGELISAQKYTRVSWAERVDLATGRPVVTGHSRYRGAPRLVWPSISGGHNWQPMAYSEQTGWVYIPVLETPSKFRTTKARTFHPDSINVLARVSDKPVDRRAFDGLLGDKNKPARRSVLKAWDPVEQRLVWKSDPQPWWSGGLLASAGGLVFQGSIDGAFNVYDAYSGQLLKRIETGSAIMAAPISYQIDGDQYIAVLAGLGGSLRAYPWGSAPLSYENRERLLVFKLGGGPVAKPPKAKPQVQYPAHPQRDFDLKMAARGRELFLDFCSRCHAYRGLPNNYPNLWNLPPALYDALEPLVLDGALAAAGMPRFDDILTREDVIALREFLLADEAKARAAAVYQGP